jgi:nitrite reductase (NO-forming)
MKAKTLGSTIAAFALVTAAAAFGRLARPEVTDLTDPVATLDSLYPALVRPASRAPVKEFRIPIRDATVQVAPGVTYRGWTFGGTIPGPVIRVREGDLVRIRLVNQASMPHSIDFHAARIPMNRAFRTIVPKDSLSFEFTARDAGAYLVHCGTPPVLLHLMQGMYLPIIVDPAEGWPDRADKEFVLVQSEFYLDAKNQSKPGEPDWNAALERRATYVSFNGRAFQYKDAPLQVAVGDRVRLFVVNAGPSLPSDFHIVGAIFDRVYPDGDPAHVLSGVQTYTVPAGGGAVFETVFDKDASGEGLYAFVTHAFAAASKGAVGIIKVGNPNVAMGGGH